MDDVRKFNQTCDSLRAEIGKVIVGQDTVIEELLIALFRRRPLSSGGRTRTRQDAPYLDVAQALDLKFSRIQFTPDLMPSDITGTEILDEDQATGRRAFRFIQGPIFGNVILADEINRTPPKTQAACCRRCRRRKSPRAARPTRSTPVLRARDAEPDRAGRHVSAAEAQLDRFMFNVRVDYPSEEEEIRIVESTTSPMSQRPKTCCTQMTSCRRRRWCAPCRSIHTCCATPSDSCAPRATKPFRR
jgi:MoxR-like ATPase